MIDLGDFYPDFREIVEQNVDAIRRAPATDRGRLCEEACVTLRTAGIAEVLVAFNIDGFHHMLTRSALTRLYLLKKTTPVEQARSRFCKISRSNAFFDALAVGRIDLARQIIMAGPPQRNADFEYEDDYLYVRFLYGMLLAAPAQEQQGTLDNWRATVVGPPSERFEVCLALLAHDAAAFEQAFTGLLAARAEELQAQSRSLSRDEMAFAGDRHIFIEGLALLRLAIIVGIPTQVEYRFCPRETRLPMTAPFPDDLYPS